MRSAGVESKEKDGVRSNANANASVTTLVLGKPHIGNFATVWVTSSRRIPGAAGVQTQIASSALRTAFKIKSGVEAPAVTATVW